MTTDYWLLYLFAQVAWSVGLDCLKMVGRFKPIRATVNLTFAANCTKDCCGLEFVFNDAKIDVELAKTELQVAILKLKVAQAMLAAHTLYAPAAGLISAPRLLVGSNFNVAESGPIATIVQLDPIHVRAEISVEKMLARLQAGTFTMELVQSLKINLSLSNDAKYALQGRIVSLGVPSRMIT